MFLSSVPAESNTPMPFIGDDDDYVVNVPIGSTHKFNWTVYRNSSQNYVVSVSASGLSAWTHRLSKDYFIIDEVHPYQVVGLSIDVPQYPQDREIQGVVTFTFRPLNQTERFSIEKTFSISVTGIYTGEENTLVGGFPNPLPFPLNNPFGAFILNILIWTSIAVLFYVFFKRIVMVLVKKTETLFDDMIVEIIRKPALLIIILYGFLHSLMKLDFHVGLIATLNNVYMIIFIFTIIYVSYRIFDEILNELTIKKGGKFSTFGTVVKPIFRKIGLSVIIIGGVIYALRYIGFDVTALLAGAGVAGLVIAFAAQDTLSNFFSGMHLLLDRPFRIGDVILLETGEYCRVDNVGMRSTKLYCIFTHELIILPNNSVANQKIVNVVKPDARIRKRIEVGVAYGSDIEKVKQILMDVALNHKNVVNEPGFEPLIRFIDFGDSSLDFRLIIWIEDVMKQWKVLSDLRFE
ncbi:MAG: mechanosensitive ion channel family protein, partial [Candidatus Thermoplasmatota archaeon]|nr:mechanosensitive ion channel family protein [Candidatus Thermoplasmatota archaeon]